MAHLEHAALARALSRPLELLCRNTITDPGLLRDELARIRKVGWASSLEETNLGVWGLAVPILDAREAIVCAIGIAGPSARLAQERIGDLDPPHP